MQIGVLGKNPRDPLRTGEAVKGPWFVEEEGALAVHPL
jgi:hypothetical protein